MTNYRSAAETTAALDYDGKLPFQAAILRIRGAERGAAAARAYLDNEVATGDRAEVLRLAHPRRLPLLASVRVDRPEVLPLTR